MSTPEPNDLPEWNDLVDAWRSAPEDTADPDAPAGLSDGAVRRIRSRVTWHGRRLVLIAAGEVMLAVGVAAWFGRGFLDPRRPTDLAAMIGTAVLFAIAFGFSVRNRLGLWRPASEATRAFVELSIERSRRKLRTVRFCRWFLALELALLIPWLAWLLAERGQPPAAWIGPFAWLALLTGGFAAWTVWFQRRTLRELAEWEALGRSLDG